MSEPRKSDVAWRAELDDETYRVTRQGGTERPFTGQFWNRNPSGIYRCACCRTELFDSEGWFESHCGWPSFDRELPEARIERRVDRSHGMERVEILCSACGAHLGHVFPDGPTATGERYCVNSVALRHSSEDASDG